jgi:RNA polymerase sigma-70 factor (ECF subfamily)
MPHVDQRNSEALLIQEAIAGNKEAFGRLYDLFAGQIFRYLYFRIGERSAAKDMTGDVFLKAWEKLPEFGRNGRGLNFRAWLYRIARNLVIDHYRTKKTEVSIEPFSDQLSGLPSAHRLVEQAERDQALVRALEGLDDVTKQVIILRFYTGLSSNEVAHVMDLSEGNIRIIQYRGLKKMRALLGADDER